MLQSKMAATTCFLIGATLALSFSWGETAPPDCSAVLCHAPSCANPVTPPGECCPSCRTSRCLLKGCVNRRQGEVVWQPDPCTFCQCLDNRPLCAAISCAFPTPEDCLGFPVKTNPWECCPSCAFGFPPNSCNVVPRPFGGRNLTVSDGGGGKTCGKRVALSTCDKAGYRADNGDKFQCVASTGRRLVEFGEDCPLNLASYMDVVKCNAVRNDDVTVGCNTVVP